jgi:alpha-ketoglutarate-dependent taurine dioxygenase
VVHIQPVEISVTTARFDAIPLKHHVGTEIRIDRETLLSGAAAKEIREILEERSVICFRDVHLTDDEQRRFAQSIGLISDEAPDGIFKVSTNASLNPNPRVANYQRASFTWHFDGYPRDVPYLATILNPRGLSETGGQTEVANCYAAFEDLPEDEKRHLETLRVVHNFETTMRTVEPWPTYAELLEWQKQGSKTQPLVWTHKSGRKSLLLGHRASHVEGMDLQEGRALLCRLCEWATQPQYVYRHEWRMGDVLIWDNTGTLHRVIPYPLDCQRLMHRTTLFGEEPVA